MGFPVVNLGAFDIAPLSEEEVASRAPYFTVPAVKMAFIQGAYINPAAPEWGRFPMLPPYAAAVTPWGTAVPMRLESLGAR